MMLATIGEAPVSTITGGLPSDVALALRVLDEIDREVQSSGRTFNRDFNVELTLNSDSEGTLVANTLMGEGSNRTQNFAIRQGKLYDRSDRTFVFTSSPKVHITIGLDFEDLPIVARTYISHRSGRVYAERILGAVQSGLRSDEAISRTALESYESQSADYRLSDSLDVARVAYRRSPMDNFGG